MADKTFGVKASDETHEKAQILMESSGLTNKEWFEKVLALYEMHAIKEGSGDYTQDISELEHHTTRIYELVVNMVQRSSYLRDHAVKEIADKLEDKDLIITDLQQRFNRMKAEYEQKGEEAAILHKQKEELVEKFVINQKMLDNSQALIEEYQQKCNLLKDHVEQYKGYAEENEQLKNSIEQERQKTTEDKAKTMQKISELESELQKANIRERELVKELENTKVAHESELLLLQERKELERDKAIVELEREYQAKLQDQNEKYNEKVTKLQAENERIREGYEKRLESLRK